jgi:hypothetical protein
VTRTYRKPLTWDGSQWVPNPPVPGAYGVPVGGGGVSATTTTLAASATSVNAGSSVTLTATVKSGAAAVGVGSVRFERNSGASGAWVSIGTVALPASGIIASAFAVSATYSYRAVYVGDTAYLTSTSGTLSVTAKTLKTATKTVACSWSKTYQSDGDARTVSEVYQGYYSSTNGNQRGLVGFPALGLPAGSTVTKVELYLYAAHWGDSGGGTAIIGTHGYTAAPGSYVSGGNQDDVRQAWTAKTGGKWITLPSSRNAGFASGAYRGCIIGPGASTSTLAYYGYFNGNGQSSEPQLRVTYTYWS